MPELKRVQYIATIHAPAATVWQHVISPDSYERWSAAFVEGSHFVGSWEAGAKIRFLSPSGDGMLAEIAQSKEGEFISIRHLGCIANGVDDTASAGAAHWIPA